jgi:hypothetical protein
VTNRPRRPGRDRLYKGERFNSISHLVGAVLALSGTAVLVSIAGVHGGAMRIVSFSVYGLTLILRYLFSTLYHGLRGRPKRVFQVLDRVRPWCHDICSSSWPEASATISRFCSLCNRPGYRPSAAHRDLPAVVQSPPTPAFG